MIFKIFSLKKKIAKKIGIFRLKTLLNEAKIWSYHWLLKNTPIFLPKIGENAENCDHNIDPRNQCYEVKNLAPMYVYRC
jgi:hypothetical protein